MKLIFICLLMIGSALSMHAQSILKFDHRFVESEDQWVAFRPDSLGNYIFGFIYIDAVAGLTLNMEGNFKMAGDGHLIVKRDSMASFKYRLANTNQQIAIIPPSFFKGLNIKPVPDWLQAYKSDTSSVNHLYRWGYYYNDWNQFEKALTYLERAYKIDPKFKGLETELAFCYNALERYPEAIAILQDLLKTTPADCYSYKELAYAQQKSGALDKSIETYQNCIHSSCADSKMKSEIACNIAYHYSQVKDKEKFNYWDTETRKWAVTGDRFMLKLEKLEKIMNN